jgi:hypothetical protein
MDEGKEILRFALSQHKVGWLRVSLIKRHFHFQRARSFELCTSLGFST